MYGRYRLKKVAMVTSTHNFPLSSLISIKSCSFFVVTNNKLDCDLLYWKNFSLVCLRGITFIPSVLKRFLKMAAGIGNEVYLQQHYQTVTCSNI